MALEGNASCADCVSQSARNSSPGAQAASGPVTGTLAGILIFTIVVDIVGNLLVILSVCRNKKLRNAAVPDVQRIGTSHLDSEQIPLRSLLGRRSLTEACASRGLEAACAAWAERRSAFEGAALCLSAAVLLHTCFALLHNSAGNPA
ncbi:hypothetical protein MHYP_G00274530 [Metynnis hypsauchen]